MDERDQKTVGSNEEVREAETMCTKRTTYCRDIGQMGWRGGACRGQTDGKYETLKYGKYGRATGCIGH